MLGDMSGRDVAEWQAFYNLELRGEDRADWRAGLIASMIANVNRGKDTDPYSPSDFIPKWADRANDILDNDEDDSEDSEDEVDNSQTLAMLATFQALTRAAESVVTPITESNVELISIPDLPENE
jgi:hypothetical protein